MKCPICGNQEASRGCTNDDHCFDPKDHIQPSIYYRYTADGCWYVVEVYDDHMMVGSGDICNAWCNVIRVPLNSFDPLNRQEAIEKIKVLESFQ